MASEFHYTNERNVQIVIALLKAHGIHRVVASPGTTNMTFIVSLENDPWFKIWSSVDERSAAYLACGMASETGEPVVISCTGATASRNYMPGLTEAYYRKLPVLAITSTRGNHKVGHLLDQQIDRRALPNDIAIESVTIPTVKDAEDERMCEVEANKAILALKLNGGGPAHINLYTRYSQNFSITEIPHVNAIYRHFSYDKDLPIIPDGKIVVMVGAHPDFSEGLTEALDLFCAAHDAVVLCDHTSGYRGKYELHYQLALCQERWKAPNNIAADLCIHIGEISGSYLPATKHTWRVSPDGEIRDTFGNLRRVFMMQEEQFFRHYSQGREVKKRGQLDAMSSEITQLISSIPELPFSNIWMAKEMSSYLPSGCELHLGIYHSLRSWNFFALPADVTTRCNVGGFGIDGGVSTMIGASLVRPDKLFIGVFGDLAFFYDMNVIGNRHVGNNVRILLINNGKGNEFRNYAHPCHFLGEEADEFVAAAGHYGNMSTKLVKNYAEDLGYEYLSATDKVSFLGVVDKFLHAGCTEKPMILEVFTDTESESKALELIKNLITDKSYSLKKDIKRLAVGVIGENKARKIMGTVYRKK